MKKILLLGASASQIPFIKTAKKLGCYVGVVDYNKTASAVEYADEYFECSILDVEGVTEIAKQFHPNGITCGASDVGVITAAKACNRLGLPGMSETTALNVKDKAVMIEAFAKNDVAHPKYQVIEDANQEINIDLPFIVKPVDNSASRGINLVRKPEDLMPALQTSFSHSNSHKLIIEEYMEGPEVSVELLIQHGHPYVLQVTDKITTEEPHFIETGHSQPSQLPIDVINAIRDLAQRAAIAVGIQDGCGHAEIKVTNQGPKMIEIAGRMGADFITTVLLPISTGVNVAEYEILRAIGEPKEYVNRNDNTSQSVAVRFIQPKPGKIKNIDLEYNAEEYQNIVEIKIECSTEKSYDSVTDNNSRLGHVIAKGKTPADALNNCEQLIKSIVLEYETE